MIVQLGQRGSQGVLVGPVPVQRGDHRRLGAPRDLREGVGDRRGQDRMRGQLHKRALTGGQTLNHAVTKPDRLPQVSGPVAAGRELLGRRYLSGEVGQDRHRGRSEGQALGDGLKFEQGRVHQRRVEGVTDRQEGGANTMCGAVLADGFERLGIPGDNHRGGSVDRGDSDPGVIGEQGLHRGFVGLDGEHRARRTGLH